MLFFTFCDMVQCNQLKHNWLHFAKFSDNIIMYQQQTHTIIVRGYFCQHNLMVLASRFRSDHGGGGQEEEVVVELDMLLTRQQLRSLNIRYCNSYRSFS